MESLREGKQTQGTTKNIHRALFQEHNHSLIETSSRFLLVKGLFLQETFLGTLETPTLNTCKTLEVSNKFL